VNPNPAGTWTAPDLAMAKRLIRESGTRGSPVRVMIERSRRPLGRYFASLLRRLGYRSSLLVFPLSAYFRATIPPPDGANVWWGGWFTDYRAPSAFIQPLLGCGSLLSQGCDRRIDAQMNRALAQQSSDPAAANTLWDSVDRRLTDEAFAVPLFNRKCITLVSNQVGERPAPPAGGPAIRPALGEIETGWCRADA
jgi:peptide/nickel transport system substrate-binding protein